MIKLNGLIVTPTVFPDKTSQVWKLPENIFVTYGHNVVTWEFENEAELITVCQLGDLLDRNAILHVPFLPYGRQDKAVRNDSTFGACTFSQIINMFYNKIETLDAHSTRWFTPRMKSIYPFTQINESINKTGATSVCFPDKGAMLRYEIALNTIVLDKTRDQSTGEVTGLEVKSGRDIKDANILIVDDICDGGRTFIEAAKLLYSLGASQVNLYTTHGIYSKGVDVLREANIKRIFNYKGEV